MYNRALSYTRASGKVDPRLPGAGDASGGSAKEPGRWQANARPTRNGDGPYARTTAMVPSERYVLGRTIME